MSTSPDQRLTAADCDLAHLEHLESGSIIAPPPQFSDKPEKVTEASPESGGGPLVTCPLYPRRLGKIGQDGGSARSLKPAPASETPENLVGSLAQVCCSGKDPVGWDEGQSSLGDFFSAVCYCCCECSGITCSPVS